MARKNPKELAPDDYLSPKELAEKIPHSVKALEAMRHRGTGPRWRKKGRRIYYKWGDAVDWLEGEGDK